MFSTGHHPVSHIKWRAQSVTGCPGEFLDKRRKKERTLTAVFWTIMHTFQKTLQGCELDSSTYKHPVKMLWTLQSQVTNKLWHFMCSLVTISPSLHYPTFVADSRMGGPICTTLLQRINKLLFLGFCLISISLSFDSSTEWKSTTSKLYFSINQSIPFPTSTTTWIIYSQVCF
jgi:hypothetical protein